MKVYIDNRQSGYYGGTDAYITIYCDDNIFGKIETKKEEITAVEIPENTRILKVSATEIWPLTLDESIWQGQGCKDIDDKFETLSKEKIDILNLNFEKEALAYNEFCSKKWQFPYDLIIQIDDLNDDLVLYFTTFPQKELAYALGYRARTLSKGEQITTRYAKRKERFYALEYRNIVMFIMTLACIWSSAFFTKNIEAFKMAEFSLEQSSAFSGICLCIMSWICLGIFFPQFWRYEEVLQESKLKSEYYLDSDGNWSSSEK